MMGHYNSYLKVFQLSARKARFQGVYVTFNKRRGCKIITSQPWAHVGLDEPIRWCLTPPAYFPASFGHPDGRLKDKPFLLATEHLLKDVMTDGNRA
jgi:hypothetical protein